MWVSNVTGYLWEMMGEDRCLLRSVVHFTFVDLDARGSADCLATFKLGHDKEHATQGPVSQQRKQETNQKMNKLLG